MNNHPKYELLKSKLATLLKIQRELSELFPGQKRNFTLDGRLVGDIGEIIAHVHYEIELDLKQRADYDATHNGQQLQIKATMQDALTFKNPEGHYLDLQIHADGTFTEIYNGPAIGIYNHFKGRKDIGTKLLRFPCKTLSAISHQLRDNQRISRRKST